MKLGLTLFLPISLIFQLLISVSAKAQGDFELPLPPKPNLKITCDQNVAGSSFFYHLNLGEDIFELNEFQGHDYDFCFLLMQTVLIGETLTQINNDGKSYQPRKVGEVGTIKFSDSITESSCNYKILKSLPGNHILRIGSFKKWSETNEPDGDILFDFLYQNKDTLDEAVEITCDNMFLS
jgi:hypothetical protein